MKAMGSSAFLLSEGEWMHGTIPQSTKTHKHRPESVSELL